MLGELVGPLISDSLLSFGGKLATAWASWVQSRVTLQMQQDEFLFRTKLESRRQDHDRSLAKAQRDLEVNRLLIRYQNDRQIEILRSRLRQDEERKRFIEQYQADHNPTDAAPGQWLRRTFATSPSIPLVLFNTHLRSDAQTDFNPLASICHQYNEVAQRIGGLTVRSFGNRAFSADDAIDQFYHCELAPLPAIFVTGRFDGNAVLIQASVFGLLPNQNVWCGNELRISGESFLIGRFPRSLFIELEQRFTSSSVGVLGPGQAHARARELLDRLQGLVVTTSLQMLVDQYLASSGLATATPLAIETFEEQIASWDQHSLPGPALMAVRELLQRQKSLFQQSRELEKWARERLLPKPSETDAPSFPSTDENGPTLYT